MYKYSFSTLLLLLIVLCLSCEKKEEIEEPEFELPTNPVEFPASARISSDILSGGPYNLANISFVAANGDKENTGSFNVDLLLDQDDYMANGVCAASIDPDDVVYDFGFQNPTILLLKATN